MLVRNLSQRGGTGNLRNHWEEMIHYVASAIGDDSVTYKIVTKNVIKPKHRIVHMNMLFNCDDFLDHFSWNLGETKTIENTKSTNDKVGNSHDKSNNKIPAETSKGTDSENEIVHLPLSPVSSDQGRKVTGKNGNKKEIKNDNKERIFFKVRSS